MSQTLLPDVATQIQMFGYAVTGSLPLDKTTLWYEDRIGWVDTTFGVWDLTEVYFQTTHLNGNRPPYKHALLPAIVAGLEIYPTQD